MTPNTPLRLAVLASGGGSNMEAITRHIDELKGASPVSLAVVISNRASAAALDKAARLGVSAAALKDPSDARELLQLLDEHGVTLVALAGYLKHIPGGVLSRFRNHVLNVHPSLLPAHGGAGMYGMKVHEDVLRSGDTVSGATVHIVTDEYDTGPVLAQCEVPVLPGDTPELLARRVLTVEHVLYPRVICAVARGALHVDRPLHLRAMLSARNDDGVVDRELLIRNIDQALSPN